MPVIKHHHISENIRKVESTLFSQMKHRQTGRMLRMHRDRVRDSGGDGGVFGGGVWSMGNTSDVLGV